MTVNLKKVACTCFMMQCPIICISIVCQGHLVINNKVLVFFTPQLVIELMTNKDNNRFLSTSFTEELFKPGKVHLQIYT